MNQNDRLEFLVKKFREDSGQYKDIEIPDGEEEKKNLLRSFMNIRLPKSMDTETIEVQDEYLRGRAEEKGIVSLSEIPEIQAGLSIWQGDIQLRAECNRQMNELRVRYGRDYEQPTAVPMLTDAFNLPAKKVVHVVGPIVQYKLTPALEKDLADCYRNTLDLCLENDLKSVAFCCISTGVFHFPNQRAAEIAVGAVKAWLSEHSGVMERIIFNVFKDEDLQIYQELLS